MRSVNFKPALINSALAASVLLLASTAAVGQQVVSLTAGPATATLPDGSAVPMWGYSCGGVTGTAGAGGAQTCAALNSSANTGTNTSSATIWSPIVITVPTGQDLSIQLTNNLSFVTSAGTNTIPTSLVIVGQLGGGLGSLGTVVGDPTTPCTAGTTCTASPDHTNAQPLTWPIAADAPGAPVTGVGTPPVQGPRVQSLATEVVVGTSQTLCWGVCGDLTGTRTALRPGTYLIQSGTHAPIQGPMGLYGVLVVTTAPVGATAGTAYPAAAPRAAVSYSADVPLLFSEIDPVQNVAVTTAVTTVGFKETNVWSGLYGGCGNQFNANGSFNSGATASATPFGTCYPPAVNYTPLYYLINGRAFDKTNPTASLYPTNPAAATSVLVRLVNAGLRMHVPSIVGATTGAATTAGMALIAEDGNVLPGVARIQSEVFMAAGKTYDVMVNAPSGTSALPIFDRQLSLSGNSVARDSGMLAYIGANAAVGAAAVPVALAAAANPDTYNSVIAGRTLTVSDPAKGVLANDLNVYGVKFISSTTGILPCNPAATPAVTTNCVTLNGDGTFIYVPGAAGSGSFMYCGNGATTGAACATVTLGAAPVELAGGITVNPTSYNANGTFLKIQPPGILAVDTDGAGYALSVQAASVVAQAVAGFAVSVDPNGGFTATSPAAGGTFSFGYRAQNSQGTASGTTACSATATVAGCAIVTIVFPPASNLQVKVLDGTDKTTVLTDYRWVIEEDRTFYVDPNCTTNPPAAGCPTSPTGIVPTFGTNFHSSYMPVVATGCTGTLSCEGGQTIFDPMTGTHIPAVCDQGNGVCRRDPNASTPAQQGFTRSMPSSVHLDPTKRYYISVLPGDAANPFIDANLSANCAKGQANAKQTDAMGNPLRCGHGMGGAPVLCTKAAGAAACTFATSAASPVTVLTQPAPYPPAKLSVFVFEDDFPLNGEHDAGGGIDVLSPNEPGLGGFNITLFDDAGGTGDATGQMTYDMFNQPLSNSLAGTIDPATQLDACPISTISRIGSAVDAGGNPIPGTYDKTQLGITGTIVTCPKYESDGQTLSPLAGQAVVANLMIGRYGVVATPGADRIGRGEEWLQTNTLDGQKAHDSFLRVGEPSFFQEYGPAGYHVSIGFANPAIINARKPYICNGTDPNVSGSNCTNTVTGQVTTERMSRTPDERLYSSGDYSSFSFTQCYVTFGDADGEDFAFTKCNPDGTFTLTGLPDGDWRITVFDQWNDMLVDGLSTPVRLGAATNASCPGPNSSAGVCSLGDIAMNQWQANIYTSTFFDANGNGVRDGNEAGLTLVATNIRFRDGSYSNFNNTDLSGNAGFNEVFPLFSWYVIETDSTRYANTGTHVVYDAGGPADGTTCGSAATPPQAPCGSSAIAANMANTAETVSVPVALRVPGAFYCADADCSTHPTGIKGFGTGPNNGTGDAPSACTISPTTGVTTCTSSLSTGRIDPPWVTSEGWQGFSGQNSFIEFGKRPFGAGENGGIHGEVIYASTRPFDDPQLLLHTSWTPDVPGVTVRLYQVGTAADGTQALTLVDTTTTSSWDDWAQGFYPNTNKPYMNCPGQLAAPTAGAAGDLFFFTLYNQPMFLDGYNNGGAPSHTVPNNSQFKCYDGMHNWNQVQPAPYDGVYKFPSIAGRDSATGKPVGGTNASVVGTNCTVCVANPVTGEPMLPAGQYVVEMVVPPGYELVKEEDKNILIGDNYIAPITQEFPGLGGAIYILPDQANVASVYNANQGMGVSGFNPTNAQNSTQALGRMSSLPSHEGDTGSVETFWPCVGQARIVPDYLSLFPQAQEVSPFAGAKRNLCDRKLVDLTEQSSVLAKFWIFTETHVAAHYTGVITDDFTSEFDPFSPQFGEKFSPANLPVAIKDWQGNEISRVYADQWGSYNGLTYSTWEVNPPNPTGYGPTMMVTCMNDPGSGTTPDALYNPAYSDFCYEIPFMPGQTQYMDTPVVPTSAFAGAGYNNPDCDYPDATPAVSEVDGDNIGPWLSATGARTLTINALGTVAVNNYAYTGPAASTAPFNKKMVTRRYSFGSTAGTVSLTNFAGSTTLNLTVTSWTDARITATVPGGAGGVSGSTWNCPIQQQTQYGGSTALCGQLVIKAANGKQSVDAVTVTIGGKTPTHVTASGPADNTCHAGGVTYAGIQRAIDCAAPGDMLIVDPKVRATATTPATAAKHEELVLMWKPVRLQGVGAGGSILDANTHPAGKLDAWRRQVNCLFGLGISGQPMSAINPYDLSGTYVCPSTPTAGAGTTNANFTGTSVQLRYWSGRVTATRTAGIEPQVDRLPLEAIVGWDASQNGNMAELLQEPSLMGALEGAGITVLSKGLFFPVGSDPYGTGPSAAEGGTFPDGTVLLTNSTGSNGGRGCNNSGTNPFSANFLCNPSSIDGLTVQDSSQGGGGIFVHGWGHNIQIANNRVTNNAGTLSGGINVGQGEFPGAYVAGSATNAPPGSCQNSFIPGFQLPYCFDNNVNMHHNMVTKNSSTGDELFSATPAGAGGVSICNGSDFYKFNFNWVCGNLSTGDGGGIAHIGFSYNGDIEHNSILFNQSTNPTIATNGGGLLIMGAPDVDPTCGAQTDQDCLNNGTTQPIMGPADGTGPNLVINANLIMGNSADSGSGGGIRLQGVNGTDVLTFPLLPEIDLLGVPVLDFWYHVKITNNIIVNNVAGWDGAGISLQDALYVDIINNTIMSNDTTASSGVLFNTLGAPLASSQGPCPGGRLPDGSCPSASGPTASTPQPAGLVSIQNSSALTANLPTSIRCPVNHYSGGSATNASCRTVSFPFMTGNVFWENRAFTISVGGLGIGQVNQQNVVTMLPILNQLPGDAETANGTGRLITGGTGACVTEPTFSSASGGYWDIGVRGDTGPTNHASTVTLSPFYSVLTNNNTSYTAAALHNTTGNPNVISQYCNGARVPPENGGLGYNVPPGIADATVPNPIFSLMPAATVDEGNNWINMAWGPLSLVNTSNGSLNGTTLGNYGLTSSSTAAIGRTPAAGGIFYTLAPSTDFYGNARKSAASPSVDAGAVEFVAAAGGGGAAVLGVSGGPLAFGNIVVGQASAAQTLTVSNTGTAATSAAGVSVVITAPFARANAAQGGPGTCTAAALNAGDSCTINVVFSPTTAVASVGTATITASVAVGGSPVSLTGTGVAAGLAGALTPPSATITSSRGCIPATCGVQGFTLTNTGNVTLTGVGSGALSGTDAAKFAIVASQSTCGSSITSLASGANCVVTVRFQPAAADTRATRHATLSVTATGIAAQQSAITGDVN
jgi:hypothetical protein